MPKKTRIIAAGKGTGSAPSSLDKPGQVLRERLQALYGQGKLDEAKALAQELLTRAPHDIVPMRVWGDATLEARQAQLALEMLQKAEAIAPRDAEIQNLVGKAFRLLGDRKQAIEHYKTALVLQPYSRAALFDLTGLLIDTGQYKIAFEYLDEAEAANPDDVTILTRKAEAHYKNKDFKKTIEIQRKIVGLHPGSAVQLAILASHYRDIGYFSKAEELFLKALRLKPASPENIYSSYLVSLHYNPEHSAEFIANAHQEWSRHACLKQIPAARVPQDLNIRKRLRIGMLSGGFRIHPVGQMVTAALENLDKNSVELYAYSSNDNEDRVTQRIKRNVSCWQSVSHLSNEALAQRIVDDGIDILIDLAGHGSDNRLLTIASRPAPLQVKWVGGLVNTMGMEAFDYLLSDPVETPPGVDKDYVEKLIRLPDDYICYLPPDYTPAVGPLPADANGYITLACFNNPAKINPELLAEWAKLMHELPDSRLLLKGAQFDSEELCGNVRDCLATHGISPERLLMEGQSLHQALLNTYNRVDIALDPWPYSGGLTTCEALLMGVPVVTRPGPTFAGRHSATHLVNAGMPELVADTWDEYRQRVLDLASDLHSLRTIRTHLRDVLLQSPVCDGPRFGGHFDTAMRAIWQRHCEGKTPAALTLNPNGEAWFEDAAQPVDIFRPEAPQEVRSGFSWQLQGKIIAIDHGSQLMASTVVSQMLQLKTLELIAFDPCSTALNSPLGKLDGVHYYPNSMLGNGEPATLYACLDPAMNATLKPLDGKDLPAEMAKGALILTRLPVSTLQLDKIEGIPAVDWLVLDAMNDSGTILEHGARTLENTLLIQAKVAFQPSHEHQPGLAGLTGWASGHGFRFYRLNEPRHRSHLPARDDMKQMQATELVMADALFIPSHARMAELTDDQRTRLAFMLHTIYDIRDMSYELLAAGDEKRADEYLAATGILPEPLVPAGPANGDMTAPALLLNKTNVHALCIGIPAYNEEKYIEQTLLSLKAQDFDDVVFFISDNASTDATRNIIGDITSNDSRFRIHLQTENIGAGGNFKFILDESKSRYFMWLGAHDYLSDNYLTSAIARITEKPGVSMVCGMPHAVMDGIEHGIVKEGIYDFSSNDPVSRYVQSVKNLGNCTIFHSVFERKLLNGFDFRATISADHVIISHLLWSGKLEYVQHASYFRRYFKQRSESQEERILGFNKKLPRTDFYQYYDDSFRELLKGAKSISAQQALQERNRIQKILHLRFK